MTSAEWHSTLFQFIGIAISLIALIFSIIAAVCAFKSLKTTRNQLVEQQQQNFEQNRGQLIFYISKNKTQILNDLIIKNFGNSAAKLVDLKITPELDWKQTGQTEADEFNITNLKDIFLAPKQHVSSIFDFRNFKDKKLNIEITYETMSKTITDKYIIDINYLNQTLSTVAPDVKDMPQGLKAVNESIMYLADKFV